jgi:membrane fusion protein, adhesin transport system
MLEISNTTFDHKALEKRVYSLKAVHTPKRTKTLARWLMFFLIFGLICMFLPWQQNVTGSGNVTAFKPSQRPQEIETAIAGRIIDWRIQEGQFVKKGDTLIVLAEIKTDYFDPEQLQRLAEQMEAKKKGLNAGQNKITALETQIIANQTALQLSLEKARNKVQQGVLKIKIDSAGLEAEKINLQVAQRQFDSYDKMFVSNDNNDIPLISRTEWEKRKQKLQEQQAKIVAQQNKYFVSQNELINAKIELGSLEAEYTDKISKAQSDLSGSVVGVAEKEEEISKLKNKYANQSIRNQQYYIVAPQDGYIVKALKTGIGETVKENDAVVMIQPANPQKAVELYVSARDVPLIQIGRQVRLEFDGWPAFQVSGWPSVTVGTFGGIVQVIDYVDSKEGKYRVLVTPDPKEPWPKELRMGSGVYGWVMLDDVFLWYEIWRQLNGFPPSLYEKPDEEESKKRKSDSKIKLKVKK